MFLPVDVKKPGRDQHVGVAPVGSYPLYFPCALTQFDAVMTRFRFSAFFAGWLILVAGAWSSRAETQSDMPDFQEVFQVIRTHVVGVNPAELNRAAVQGFLAKYPVVNVADALAGSGGHGH